MTTSKKCQKTTKWFVMSTLTSRYIGSPESQMDFDIKRIFQKCCGTMWTRAYAL